MADTSIVIDSQTINFNEGEWKTMLNAPFIIFFAVSAADGKIDKKEVEQFAKLLGTASKYRCPILTKILSEALPHFMDFINGLATGQINPLKELISLADISDKKLPSADAKVFKISLVSIAKDIAESSGGFLGFGSKISKEEMQTINGIASALKVTF